MPRLTNLDSSRHSQRCVAIVLLAVFSLTLNVATRYCFAGETLDHGIRTVQKHASPVPTRQRLAKNAAAWMPPLVCLDPLQSPTSYHRSAPAEPPVQNLLPEENLYNRPPPAL